ncbi:MAG: transposase [Anaerolineae bacterium]|nr:transposase [Anaerolineae bacterium]
MNYYMKDNDQHLQTARIAYQIARETLPRYAHAKSPHFFTFQQLGACALVRSLLRISYRDMQSYLKDNEPLRRVLELRSVPDYSTLLRTEQKMQASFDVIMDKLLNRLESLPVQSAAPVWPSYGSSYDRRY